MTIPMMKEELDLAIEAMTEVDRFDYRNPESEDDYFNAVLAKTPEGRLFRFVENSGMSSHYCGALNTEGEWIEEAEWSKTYKQWAK